MKRRSFLKGLLAAPVVAVGVKALPVEASGNFGKSIVAADVIKEAQAESNKARGNQLITIDEITKEALKLLHKNMSFVGKGNLIKL